MGRGRVPEAGGGSPRQQNMPPVRPPASHAPPHTREPPHGPVPGQGPGDRVAGSGLRARWRRGAGTMFHVMPGFLCRLNRAFRLAEPPSMGKPGALESSS